MSEQQAGVVDTVDPRVRRTRLLLQDGLSKLLREKEFDRISVQDIADAAGLHRATFYDHYPDKTALLECMVGSHFQQLLVQRGVSFGTCDGALRAIALGVCDYISGLPGSDSGGGRQLASHMESAVIAVVRRMLLEGLHQHPVRGEVSAEVLAATASWAVYGAAKEWLSNPQRASAEEMASVIERLVLRMISNTE